MNEQIADRAEELLNRIKAMEHHCNAAAWLIDVAFGLAVGEDESSDMAKVANGLMDLAYMLQDVYVAIHSESPYPFLLALMDSGKVQKWEDPEDQWGVI